MSVRKLGDGKIINPTEKEVLGDLENLLDYFKATGFEPAYCAFLCHRMEHIIVATTQVAQTVMDNFEAFCDESVH
jgi:hypothetical protein